MGSEAIQPAIGQKWMWLGGGECIVRSITPAGCERHGHNESGCAHFDSDMWAPLASFKRADFLGWAPGYGPTPALGVPVVMGEYRAYDGKIYPTGCLGCGVKVSSAWYTCHACFTADDDAVRLRRNEEWKAGARDFPRPAPATPQPEAPRGVVYYGSVDGETWCEMPQVKAAQYPYYRVTNDGKAIAETGPVPVQSEAPRGVTVTITGGGGGPGTWGPVAAIPASKPLPVNPRHEGELQRNGVALSALGAVPARKPPEPWYPSVSDDFWIPDAGE